MPSLRLRMVGLGALMVFGCCQPALATAITFANDSTTGPSGTGIFSGNAVALGVGGLGWARVRAFAQLDASGPVNGFTSAAATASVNAGFTLTDLLIGSPGGGPSTVSGSLNLSVEGTASFQSHTVGNGSAYVYNSGGINATAADETRGVGFNITCGNLIVPCSASNSGGFNSSYSIFFQNLPVNVEFSLTLGVTSDVGAVVQSLITLDPLAPATSFNMSESDYGHTVTFSLSGPVFTLPDGYTVNSVDGNIVDNRWIDTRDAQPVPEPASVVTILSGLAACGIRFANGRSAARVRAPHHRDHLFHAIVITHSTAS